MKSLAPFLNSVIGEQLADDGLEVIVGPAVPVALITPEALNAML